jgi:hypothetical protein
LRTLGVLDPALDASYNFPELTSELPDRTEQA